MKPVLITMLAVLHVGCQASQGTLLAPTECFVVKGKQGFDRRAVEIIKSDPVAAPLVLDNSNPGLYLFDRPERARAILFHYHYPPFGAILASYSSKSAPAPDIARIVTRIEATGSTVMRCPPTGRDFSPPTFYE
jgi:hypothetical protein